MELWIRSQNKIDLIKVDDICYNEVYKNEHTLWFRDVALGIYKSKERALEVLDEIQHSFTSKRGMITSQSANSIEFIPYNDQIVIYEMPKE